MTPQPLRKNKINLSDYPYQKDIEHRLLMAELSVFDVTVLTEIIHGSLKMSLKGLADILETEPEKLLPTVDKLQKMKLYKLEKETLYVNKEQRKYYETQLPKFDDNFRADIEFVRNLLSKVPIHMLPQWYSIPKSSDDIFMSIVEKYLQTPKIYQRYLNEVSFDDKVLHNIMDDVFEAPDQKVVASDLIKKYKLSKEKFEEYMLLLEYNLICYLSYNQTDSQWVEVITPLHEWRQYQRIIRTNTPKPITDTLGIVRNHSNDFGFVHDMTTLLNAISKKPVPLSKKKERPTLEDKTAQTLFPDVNESFLLNGYTEELFEKLQQLKLIEIKDNAASPKKGIDTWLGKPLQEQAIMVYRYISSRRHGPSQGYIDRNLRETEKCLKRVMKSGWIYFSDFAKSCTASIGDHAPVALECKGRRWKYRLPSYNDEDIAVLYNYIFNTLFQSGIVATGIYQDKPCFAVTPFGRMTID